MGFGVGWGRGGGGGDGQDDSSRGGDIHREIGTSVAEAGLAAFEHGLVEGEVDCPRGEGAFLDDPAAGVERGVFDAVVPEVVLDELEVVEGDVPIGSGGEADGDWLALIVAGGQRGESAVGVDVVACGETAVGVAVYGCHGAGFGCPVFGGVLDDAEGVDPEVADSHGSGGFNRINKGTRESGKVYSVPKPRDVAL